MDTILVILIVGAAVLYIVRHFRNKFKGQGDCNCGSCSCKDGVAKCDASRYHNL